MLNLKLKQAEKAFADGRLDEAYGLLTDEKVASHRQGQKLTAKLADRLVDRGNDHLTAGRIDSALSDCNRAEKLAGNLTSVADLRTAICSAIEHKRFTGSQQQALINDARENIQNGMHSVGRQLLEKAESSAEAQMLLKDVSVIAARSKAVAGKAQDALNRNDLEAACDIIIAANIKSRNGGTSSEIIRRARLFLCDNISQHLNCGRIDLAENYMHRLMRICPECIEAIDFGSAISLCSRAWQYLQSKNIRAALECIERLRVLLPDAKWIDKAAENAFNAAQAIDKLMVGPLSMTSSMALDQKSQVEIQSNNNETGHVTINQQNISDPFPSQFVMQIDGVGSYLVICDDSFTLGPVSSSEAPVVGLIAEPDLPVVTINRTDGDYFIRSKAHFSVNDTKTNDKLLGNGDRISLSMRCRMRFNIPNAASSTAIISLASARYTNADVRSIILMDREILIGPSVRHHIPAAQIEESLVVIRRNGKIYCRAEKSGEKEMLFGQSISIGGVNIVFKNI